MKRQNIIAKKKTCKHLWAPYMTLIDLVIAGRTVTANAPSTLEYSAVKLLCQKCLEKKIA